MERDQNSALTDPFIKGGQVTKNSIVMFWQNIKMVLFPTIVVYSILATVIFFSVTDEYQRYLWSKNLQAEVHLDSMGNKSALEFKYPDGEVAKVKAADIVASTQVINAANKVSWIINILSVVVLILTCVTFVLARNYLKSKGEKLSERKVVDGMRPFKDISELSTTIKQANDKLNYESQYSFLDVPFYNGTELFHISVAGAPGQGKTQVLIPIVEQIRANNHKAFIYDKARAYVKYFYNADVDVILNPLDSRSPAWNIHAEAKNAIDYDSIFEAMIPMAKNTEPYWTLAARTVASKTALRFRQAREYRMAPMLERLYNTSLDEIAAMLKGTEAGAIIDCKNPKTGESLRSVLSTYVKGLGYCYDAPVVDPATGEQDINRLFSITKWIQDDNRKGMVYITSQGDQEATLKPLITTFFNIAVSAGMSMEADLNRRIFIMLDELPALNQLPAIQRAAAELRQFGFVVVGGWQLYSMLEEVYGAVGARSLSGIFNTVIQFNAGKEEYNVKHASKQFGTYTVRVPKDSLSIGVGPYRDGANFNFDDVKYDCVTESDIRMLPPLNGYVSMAGGVFPVAKFTKEHYEPEHVAASMIVRPLEQLSLGHYLVIGDGKLDLDELIESEVNKNSKTISKKDILDAVAKTTANAETGSAKADETTSQSDGEEKRLPKDVVRQLGAKTDERMVNESSKRPPMKDGLFDVEEAERKYLAEQQAKSKQNVVDDPLDLFN